MDFTHYYTPAQLAERWGVQDIWIREMARAGRLPHTRYKNLWLFPRADITRYEYDIRVTTARPDKRRILAITLALMDGASL